MSSLLKRHLEVRCSLSWDDINSSEFLKSISAADYGISARSHGVILALIAGRSTLPVIYSDNVSHTLDNIDFEGRSFDLRSYARFTFELSKGNQLKHKRLQLEELQLEAQEPF